MGGIHVTCLSSPSNVVADETSRRRACSSVRQSRVTSRALRYSSTKRNSSGGVLSKWRRGGAESLATDGCDPAVFGDQISDYLKEAAAERAVDWVAERKPDLRRPRSDTFSRRRGQ